MSHRNWGTDCRTIQIIEPDSTLLVATSSGSIDQALDERGEVILDIGQSEVVVEFVTNKLNQNYRFEYLYVDGLGIINPGTINPVVIRQTVSGFTVDLAGAPPVEGYILRWRVVIAGGNVAGNDLPQEMRIQLPQATTCTIPFSSPRSNTDYGFSELRIENLIDAAGAQTAITMWVTAKTLVDFTVALSPAPDTDNYYLVIRTP